MRKLTNFTFFKHTPLIDFQNTIHFDSNDQRDQFFLEGNHYPTLQTNQRFNFIRDKSTLDISIDYNEMRGVNYCTFKSDFEDTRYYAYVMNYEYIGSHDGQDTVRVYLLIDGIMTYTQGGWLNTLRNLTIDRQHLSKYQYESRLWELKNNDDILKTSTKQYIQEDSVLFDDLVVVIQSSVDLTGDFGTEDNPKMKTSSGITFDHISSPLELYVVEQNRFKDFMDKLHPFPWIAQNIRSMLLIPKDFIDGRYQSVSTKSDFPFQYLNRLQDGMTSLNNNTRMKLESLNYTMNELYELFNLDPIDDRHLLRNEYTTTEFYTFNGQQLLLDNGLLNPNFGIELHVEQVIGFNNEVHIYPRGYQTNNINSDTRSGTFLNNSISFDHFDDVPMLIDNYALALANNANQRQLAEDKQISNRISNVLDPNANLKDRFFDAASIISNFSVTNLFGKFADEHDFYRQQKAEFADLALASPTITNQTHGNSLQVANGFFGFHQKFSAPSTKEWQEIKKYYKLFGYQVMENGAQLQPVNSMTICNYVQFSGSWSLPNTDVAIIEIMKAQFENGVRLWHYDEDAQPLFKANPMAQDTLNNKMR